MTTHIRRSLALSPAEWAALDRLAETFSAIPDGGPQQQQPSWRNLLKRIANGELALVKPN